MPLAVGSRLGPYEVTGIPGAGGKLLAALNHPHIASRSICSYSPPKKGGGRTTITDPLVREALTHGIGLF